MAARTLPEMSRAAGPPTHRGHCPAVPLRLGREESASVRAEAGRRSDACGARRCVRRGGG
jgi:hypothetical protein